ncbi:hypothetical protein D3C80_2043160 [compost metagenome]
MSSCSPAKVAVLCNSKVKLETFPELGDDHLKTPSKSSLKYSPAKGLTNGICELEFPAEVPTQKRLMADGFDL